MPRINSYDTTLAILKANNATPLTTEDDRLNFLKSCGFIDDVTHPEKSTIVDELNYELAAQLLRCNVDNRHIHTNYVNTYTHDMKAGRWAFTGDFISFDRTGLLISGQKRLLSVIEADATIKAGIVVGVDNTPAVDTAQRRSAADNLFGKFADENGIPVRLRGKKLAQIVQKLCYINIKKNYQVSPCDTALFIKHYQDELLELLPIINGKLGNVSFKAALIAAAIGEYDPNEKYDPIVKKATPRNLTINEVLNFYNIWCANCSTDPVDNPVLAFTPMYNAFSTKHDTRGTQSIEPAIFSLVQDALIQWVNGTCANNLSTTSSQFLFKYDLKFLDYDANGKFMADDCKYIHA